MQQRRISSPIIFLMLLSSLAAVSCSTPARVAKEGYHSSSADAQKIVRQLPDYQQKLQSLRGKGRAYVSEPNNSERVTLEFASNRSKSLVTIRNGIGIEGGKLLTDGDTLLVYNKVDHYARKIPIREGRLDNINQLASLNILNLINYTVEAEDVRTIRKNSQFYRISLKSGARLFVDKKSLVVREVIQPQNSQLPYSKITYQAYSTIDGFTLPRQITIFGADGQSKIALQLISLKLNPTLDPLTIDLPNDIRIYYR